MASTSTPTQDTPRQGYFATFNRYNWINLFAYAFNICITYGLGTLGWLGRPSNGELSDKYMTIITPNSLSFTIWILIFFVQALWVVIQLLVPSQRNTPGIKAVGYKYLGVALVQAGWTFAFSYEVIWLSLLFMLAILGFLLWAVLSLQKLGIKTWWQYALWQFPLSIHCGWIMAASALNINVVLVAYGASVNAQIAIAALCLIALFLGNVGFLLQYPVDLTPPCVLVWALGGIYKELQAPQDSITARFTQSQIDGFGMGAIAGAGVLLALILVKVLYVAFVQRKQQRTEPEEKSADVESGGSNTSDDEHDEEKALQA